MGIIGNLDNFMKFQSANALEAAARNPGGDASAGIGMGMGFAMANQLGQMVANPSSAAGAPLPPPLPREPDGSYYVGKHGKQAGPFDRNTIDGYIRNGSITKDTLLWKEGMASWQPAAQFDELAPLLAKTPPPLPE